MTLGKFSFLAYFQCVSQIQLLAIFSSSLTMLNPPFQVLVIKSIQKNNTNSKKMVQTTYIEGVS